MLIKETFYVHSSELPDEAIIDFVYDGEMVTDLEDAIERYDQLKEIYKTNEMEFKKKLFKLEITVTEVQVSND